MHKIVTTLLSISFLGALALPINAQSAEGGSYGRGTVRNGHLNVQGSSGSTVTGREASSASQSSVDGAGDYLRGNTRNNSITSQRCRYNRHRQTVAIQGVESEVILHGGAGGTNSSGGANSYSGNHYRRGNSSAANQYGSGGYGDRITGGGRGVTVVQGC